MTATTKPSTVIAPDIAAPDERVSPARRLTRALVGRAPRSAEGAASRSAEAAIQRLLLVLVPLWLAVAASGSLAAPQFWPAARVQVATSVVVVGYLWFWRSANRQAVQLVAPTAAAAFLMMTGHPAAWANGGSLAAGWLYLATFITGALVKGLRGQLLSLGIVVGAVTIARVVAVHEGLPPDWHGIAVAVALSDSLTTGGIMSVLRRAARATDSAQAAARAEAEAGTRQRAARAEARRLTRLLHDTVVNTLCSVRLTAIPRAQLAGRCAADLAALRGSSVTTGEPEALLKEVREQAVLLGLNLTMRIAPAGPALPAPESRALSGAFREVLNNVAKHSGGRRVDVAWSWNGVRGDARISDPGKGFDASHGYAGGAGQSILARCAEAGVAVEVNSVPGSGTSLEFSWRGNAPDLSGSGSVGWEARDRAELGRYLAEGTLRIVAAQMLLAVVVVMKQSTPTGLLGALASLLILVAMGIAAHQARERVIRTWVTALALPIAAFAGAFLPGLGMTGAARLGENHVGAAVTAFAILVDRRGLVALATGLGYILGLVAVISQLGPVPPAVTRNGWSTVVVNGGVVFCVYLFRTKLIATWRAGMLAHAQVRVARERAASSAAADRVRGDLVRFATTVAEPLLAGMAEGVLDPADPGVRADCERAETTLRSLAMVPIDEAHGFGQVVAAELIRAHTQGARLHLSLVREALPASAARPRAESLLGSFTDLLGPRDRAQLTLMRKGEESLVMAVVEASEKARPELAGALRRAADSGWQVSVVGSQVLLEATWPLAMASEAVPGP